MRHFIQYHNSENMGYPASRLPEPRAYTNNSVRQLPSNALWLISGEGTSPKEFYLAAVFKVTRVSADCYDHPKFANAAYGVGHIFGETIPLNGLPWFETFKKDQSNFKYGLVELKDPAVLTELQALAGAHAL